jgi:hypothetical protein
MLDTEFPSGSSVSAGCGHCDGFTVSCRFKVTRTRLQLRDPLVGPLIPKETPQSHAEERSDITRSMRGSEPSVLVRREAVLYAAG